jgi:hypothetical protein
MNPIDEVRERLSDGHLWQKGDIGQYDLPGTSVCLIGACYAVCRVQEDWHAESEITDQLARVIAEQFPDRGKVFNPWGDVSIPAFNDAEDTTWAEVSMVLDKASARWDEAHQ